MQNEQSSYHDGRYEILVCGLDLQLRAVRIDDATPTGLQIAEAAGLPPIPQITVLQWLPHGLEDIRPNEVVKLKGNTDRFIVAESDVAWRMMIDGVRYDWPANKVPVTVLRTLAAIPDNKSVFLVDPDRGEILVADDRELDLTQKGIENLVTRTPFWKLNVQGVTITVNTPTIAVQQALELAGVSTDQGWHIYLIVEGHDKREVSLSDYIDLTTPGIEKLRLTPKDVNNGEIPQSINRQFRLLPADEKYLDTTYPGWQAILEHGRQWVIVPQFKIPSGYNYNEASLAIEVPPTYPMAQIDMFYLFPAAVLLNGIAIPATEVIEVIEQKPYQRWSRHRNGRSTWRPGVDNVLTHLALVESALLKETQQ